MEGEMKTLAWFASLVLAVALPAICLAQYPAATANTAGTRSVLRSADHVEWADMHGGTIVGGGGCGCTSRVGCSTPVCRGYDSCCPRPQLLCCLKRVARMLDCLLPCNKCCPGGCLFANCQPHLFHRGRCGGGMGCTTSCTSGCPSCSTPVGQPHLSDPFQDDPMPPMPTPEPTRDVRSNSAIGSPHASHSPRAASPYKVSTGSVVARQRAVQAAARTRATPATRGRIATHSAPSVMHGETSIPRRTTLQRPVAPASSIEDEATVTPPALLPRTIRQAAAEIEVAELEIPVNPLR
jgi:hypothetical protein